MTSREPDQTAPTASAAPKRGLQLMALILVVMTIFSVYSNLQKVRRDRIETVTILPAPSPSPSPSVTPAAEP